MKYVFALFLASPAFADAGLHHHPHGVDYGWIVAAALGIAGGYVLARIRGRK